MEHVTVTMGSTIQETMKKSETEIIAKERKKQGNRLILIKEKITGKCYNWQFGGVYILSCFSFSLKNTTFPIMIQNWYKNNHDFIRALVLKKKLHLRINGLK